MVVLRIVCVFIVLWGSGILAAPTVTYDQRQHGDFNLQVDMDDVAILLMPGSEFAQRSALSDKVYKIFGRRNGGQSKKKQKNCSTTTTTTTTTSTTTTTTERPEVPYSEVPPSLASTSQGYEEVAQGPEEVSQGHDEVPPPPSVLTAENTDVVAESDANDRPGESADRKPAVSTGDLLSVTPAKVLATDHAAKEADDVAVVADQAVAKTEDKSAVVETATVLAEMVVVKTVEKSAGSTASDDPDDLYGGDVKADVKPIETDSKDFEEKQPSGVSAPSSDVKTAGDETKEIEETATDAAKAEDVVTPSEKTNIVEKPEVLADITKTAETENKPAETNVVVKPVQAAAADEKSSGVTQANTDKIVEPVEMVAMKTLEKPTFAEAIKVVRKPVDADAADKGGAVVTGKGVPSSEGVAIGKEPTEMIAMKTVEKPSSTETAVDRSGITASTKPMEVQADKKTPAGESVETIVSRSAPKQTEMVAVKTMENPATISTVKSVISVKTVIRPGTPKTTILSTGSSIMRKVGDRKPLPSVSLDVAPPKVV